MTSKTKNKEREREKERKMMMKPFSLISVGISGHRNWNLLFIFPLLVSLLLLSNKSTNVYSLRLEEQDGSEDQCPLSYSIQLGLSLKHNITYINPNADVYFTVFLPEFDCYHLDTVNKRDSLIYLNAIKYALNLLNDKSHVSIIEKEDHNAMQSVLNLFPLFSNVNSFSTRVTYGAKIIFVNNNNNQEGYVKHLKCVLKTQNGEKTTMVTGGTTTVVQDLAFIDGAQVFDKNNKEALDKHIPIIPLTTSESILTAPFRASLIINLLDILEWKHFSIITSRNEDSLYIVKILGQLTHTEQICISDILEMPAADHLHDGDRKSSLIQFEQRLFSFINAIFHPSKRIPILVISNDQNELSMISEILYENYDKQIQNHQFFFTIIPSPELLARLQRLSEWTKVITLTSKLPNVPLRNETRSCFAMTSSHFDNDIWKNWLSFSPIRYIVFMSIALNLARNDICNNNDNDKNQTSFWCEDLVRFERKLFFNYLSDLEDKVEMPLMTLSSIDTFGKFHDLLLYNGNEFKFINSDYSLDSSNCINNDCNSCIKFRQSRKQTQISVENNVPMKISTSHDDHDEHDESSHLFNNERENISNEDDMIPNEDVSMLHVETYEITLGLLLPLHKSGSSILDCSTELNLPAYYIYEASKWIVDKINQNNYLISGIEIKLELIDTCSSPFYATQELAHLTSSDSKVQPIAFVSSLPRDHYKQIVEFISSINYTLIATQDISLMDFNFGPKYGILQTATTSRLLIKTLIEQLKYFGWRYVSVVVDPDDLVSSAMFHYYQEMAIQEKICFVSIEHVSNSNTTLAKLVDNYKNGANIVVLLTNYVNTVNLMSYYRSYTKFDRSFNGNLHFMVVRDQNLELVYGFEEEYLGSIFIRESIGNINHFDNYFLDLVSNPRKDKFLYSFIQQCGVNSAQCLRTISSFDKTITTNTMQAILSIVGGFARMRNQTCTNEKGICNEMLYSDFHRNLLKFILNTRSMRIDSESDKKFKSENFDIFEFASDGSSARDIEILNFKHDHSNGLFHFDNVALYNHNHQSLIKNPNVRYVFYKFNGIINGHKEYNETEFISSDCVNLKKCIQCEPQSPEFIYMPSWDNLIVSGIFDVHRHSAQNPFICEQNETIYDNIQNVEAFIWTIDLINQDSNILPGVHLGTLIFDTCSSYQKIYRDVSNFLSNSLLLGDYKVQIPNSESLAGFIVDGSTTKVIDSVLDLTKPLNMSVLSTDACEIKYNDIRHYPQFLGLSLPNNIYVDAMINVLKKYSWTYVSVLYENNNFITYRYVDAFSYFQHKAQQNSIQIGTKEAFNENNIYNTIKNLKSFAKIGSRIIVVFLSQENLKKFLSYNFAIDENNGLLPHEVIYLTIDSQQVFQQFSQHNINAITFSQDKHIITEFEDYFFVLSAQKNQKNPWFTQYWEKVHNCKGYNCNKIQANLKQKNITINPKTTNIIHSVVALAHGLEYLRRKLCPTNYNGLCPEFHQHLRQDSQVIYNFIKQNGFISFDGSQFSFNPKSNYLIGHLNIFNLQKHHNILMWNDIGKFDYENGLIMSKSKMKFNSINGTTMPFSKVISVCQDSSQCEALKELNVNQTLPLVPVKEAQATIALLIPLHDIEKTSLDNKICGHINPDAFEKFMAFYYSLDHINQQSQMIHLNVLILDVCALDEEKLVRILSDYNFTPKIVSVLSFEENNNNHLSQRFKNQFLNLLGDYNPFVYNFHQSKNEKQNFFFNENADLDKKNHQMLTSRSITDLCSRLKWSTINLVYSNEFIKNYFIFEANKNNICVDKTIQVTMKDIISPNFQNDWNTFAQTMDSNIIVLLTNSDINEYLIKYSTKNLLERFIWIGDRNLKSASANAQKSFRKNIEHVIILKRFSKETSLDHDMTITLDNMSKYFNVNNQRVGHKILNGWLHEYWQRKFHCSSYTQKHDPKCFDSKYARKALLNIKEIKHLIDFVRTLSGSITKFVANKCQNKTKEQLDDLCLYNFHLRNELKNNIIEDLTSNNNYFNDYKQINSDGHYEVEVMTNFGKTINIFNTLNWVNVSDIIMNRSTKIQTFCHKSCNFCTMQLSQSKNKSVNMLFSDSLQSSLISENNLYRTWYIVLSILSTLGIIMVLICVLYFILIFPLALGTTIIGYQILIGLFFCFLINFAYLLPITHTICWVRQFGLSFAYCIILSGFFVKSYNYWCQILLKKSTKTLKYNTPLAQLSISLVFIIMQLILTLVTMHNLQNGPTFNYDSLSPKCTFVDHNKFLLFQPQFILPLALLVVLFGFIMFFSIKTFNNQESRWIFLCSFITALLWTSWLATITMHLHENFILTIMANLINAFIIILLLYIRKLYLFSKISRKILKERRVNMEVTLQGEPFVDGHQQYGAFKTCTDHISWSNVHNRINFLNATRSPFEGDQEDNISSCGSVKSTTSSQVQCQELYPMEVYDNQQLTSTSNQSKITQSTRSIYDLIDDENMK